MFFMLLKKEKMIMDKTNRKLWVVAIVCLISVYGLFAGVRIQAKTVSELQEFMRIYSDEMEMVKALQTKTFSLNLPYLDGMSKTFKSSNPAIASVNENGLVTMHKCGTIQLEVTVQAEDVPEISEDYWQTPEPSPSFVPSTSSAPGASIQPEFSVPPVSSAPPKPVYRDFTFSYTLHIIEPKLSIKEMNLAKGCSYEIFVQGTDFYMPMEWKSSNPNVAFVSSIGQRGILYARKKGKADILVQVAGISLSVRIYVTNPVIKNTYAFLTKGGNSSIQITGLNSKSKISYKAQNKKVATVTSRGKVKAKRLGSTIITCTVDQASFYYSVSIGKKKAIQAIRSGLKLIGHSRYSQTKRMQKGYYDCSSFVHRVYKKAGVTLISNGWAPTAAEIGRYMDQKKKTLKTNKRYWNIESMKPGDLICYRGLPNGRYKNINHVALYCGNGIVLEASNSLDGIVMRSFWIEKPLKKHYVIGRIV